MGGPIRAGFEAGGREGEKAIVLVQGRGSSRRSPAEPGTRTDGAAYTRRPRQRTPACMRGRVCVGGGAQAAEATAGGIRLRAFLSSVLLTKACASSRRSKTCGATPRLFSASSIFRRRKALVA